MIKSFNITGLYGLYTYNIDFTGQPLKILTGPNGFGKSTILRCINHIYSCNFWFFYYLPFKDLKMEMTDGVQVIINKVLVSKECESDSEVETKKEENVDVFIKKEGGTWNEKITLTEQYVRDLERPYFMRRREENQDHEQIIAEYYRPDRDPLLVDNCKNTLLYFRPDNCHYVEEQRLIFSASSLREREPVKYTIDIINDSLISHFFLQQNEYAKTCRKVDGSFIRRLADMTNNPEAKQDKEDSKILFEKLKNRIGEYRKYHLVDDIDLVDNLDMDRFGEVLDLYLQDMNTKLDAFKDYFRRLQALDKFISNKELSYKNIKLDERGISVYSQNGDPVPLNKLSSGEQNLIILCYRLVFESKPNDILLVDEPENSMHMAWLEYLLQDYKTIAEATQCQIIIATHSPVFIHGEWDLTFDLCENNEAEIA